MKNKTTQKLVCLHKWKEIEDYDSYGWIFSYRIKIFECVNCGRQIPQEFPIKLKMRYDKPQIIIK